jgi:flagellin
MALTIGTNVASLQASAAASSVNRDLETSMSRLSTGKRINSASDDAAGVAIASRLTAEIRGTDQAIRNALDGQALIDTAEGGHKEIEAILQRMREVSIQAASDTNNAQDRGNLQAEMDALTTEIDRIAGVTTWAGNSVMDGGGGASTTASPASKTFSLQVGAATGTKNQIAVAIKAMDASTLGVGSLQPSTLTTADNVSSGNSLSVINGDTASFTGGASTAPFELTIAGTTFTAAFDTSAATTASNMANQINASTDMQLVTASTSGAVLTLTYDHAVMSVDTATNARASVSYIDAAIKTVNSQRSELGAISNRLSHTVSNMTNISTNLSAARGGIEDADFAVETTQLAKNQILQQASTAMLAQANASKQNVLSLLQ